VRVDVVQAAPPLRRQRELEILTGIAARTSNSVVVTDLEGRIEWVNDGFTRLTGYPACDVIGRRPAELLQGPDTCVETRAQMRRAIARGEPFDVEVLNYGRDGRQYWVRIESEPLRSGGELTGFLAVQTDVTASRVHASREAVLRAVGARLMAAETIEQGAGVILDELLGTSDIRAASVWLVDDGLPHLAFVDGRAADASAQPWVEVCREKRFRRGTDWVVGVGAPGVAWGTGQACVKTDFWEKDQDGHHSRRAVAAREARIRTVCAVPVRGPDGVLGVLEIGGSHRYPGHQELPSLAAQVSDHFGAFLAQHRSAQAFTAVFLHSPDALIVATPEGLIRRANGAAESLLGPLEGRWLGEVLRAPGVEPSAASMPSLEPGEWLALTPSGSRLVDLRLAPIRLSGGTRHLIALRDLSERKRVEDELRVSVDEKRTLLKELNHRVKNNLQVISSLLTLESRAQSPDSPAQDALRVTGDRIRSIALVHRELYADGRLSAIALDGYVRRLAQGLLAAFAPTAELRYSADAVELSVERAVPVGIVLNELLTNACKYGKSSDGSLHLDVRLRAQGDRCTIRIADLGPGPSQGPTREGAVGQQLVHALVRQVRGELDRAPTRAAEKDPGTAVSLSFGL
jgi:PAS domain S-box-containing protein